MKAVIIFLLLISLTSGWWPFDDDEEEEEVIVSSNTQLPKGGGMVPFEMKNADQKFLQEANQFLNLSPLDKCQHRVVSMLRKSCGDMTEEELAKLSVQLLNCQSEAEGRDVFTCTEDMSVAECTSPMDAHMWNAYHIISNRARSVCYATRQSQFRRQTETAVNQLSHSTIQQLKAMEELSNTQQEIRKFAHESLSSLQEEQENMIQRQSNIATYQDTLKHSIEQNINQLTEERLLIHTGQDELHNMTKSIRNQLHIAQEMLVEHEKSRQQSQKRMNEEINNLRNNIKEVWSRIDNSTGKLLVLLSEMNTQYKNTMDNLNTINNTITHVLSLLDTMNGAVNIQLGWLLQKLGGAEDGLHTLTTIASHSMFLFLAGFVLLFLKAPWFSRVMLLLVVIGNLSVEMKLQNGFTVPQLTVIISTILLGNFGVLWYQYQSLSHLSSSRTLLPPPPPPPPPMTLAPSPPNSSRNTLEISDDEIDDLYNDISINGGYIPQHTISPFTTSTLADEFPLNSPVKCAANTRSGLPCRLYANPGSKFCHRHK